MPGLWSAVSGTINAGEGALWRAHAEIREETGIGAGALELAGSALPLDVDPEGGYAVRVFGFLFESDTDAVRLNWESSEYRWVRRSEIGLLDAVPRLGDVLDLLL